MGELVRFESTVWTVIENAKRRDPAAIERMIGDYSAPLLGFIRNRGFRSEDAEDLLQEVLMRIYDADFLQKADRHKGKFRSILLGVTKKCILKHYERRGALKRGGGGSTISIEDLRVSEEGDIPIATEENEDFNRLWFENILRLALKKLEDESARSGKPHHRALTLKLRGASYQEIGRQLSLSETDVTNLLHAARKKLQAIAEEVIANYSSTNGEYQQEADLFGRILPA
jgi:RNA polymerase sigma factor (sigma-70 family)